MQAAYDGRSSLPTFKNNMGENHDRAWTGTIHLKPDGNGL